MTVAAERTINNDKDVARKIPGTALEDNSITAAQLAPGAVEAGDVPDGSISTDKLATGALAASAAGRGKMADGFLSADATGRAKVADGFVLKAKIGLFCSTEQTGTGAPQNVAHGLGAAPATNGVLVGVTEDPAGTGFTVLEGAHDTTNVILTVTTGVKFKVWAIR